MSNFVGYMLQEATRLKFEQVVILGHFGKLVKIAAGIFHTHSHIADARMETLIANLALIGAPLSLLQEVDGCTTTEAAIELINAQGWQAVYPRIAEKSVTGLIRCCVSPMSRRTVMPFCSRLIIRCWGPTGRSAP